MIYHKNKLVLFLMIITICLLSKIDAYAVGNEETQLEKVVLQLKWLHQFQFAGFYAALEKGYYRQEGLDVEILEGGPEKNISEAVLSGKATFGVLDTELILENVARKKPFIIVAPIMQHSVRAFIVKKNSNITSPHDMVGKTVAMKISEGSEFIAMFLSEGVEPEKVNLIDKDSKSIEKFINGEIDAISGSIANEPFIYQKRGLDIIQIRPISYGIDFYGDCIFTTEQEIKNHPQRVEKFRKATLKGWEYAFKNQEEIIDLIINKYNVPKEKEHLNFEARILYDYLVLPDLVEIGHSNIGRWEKIAETYANLNLMPKNYNIKNIIYDPNPKPDYTLTIAISISTIAVFGIVALILFIFNKRLSSLVNLKTAELQETNTKLNIEIKEKMKAEEELSSAYDVLEETNKELILSEDELKKQYAELEKRNEQIKSSLKEKETLIKEVHHRVKNNLQIISSLIRLQTKKTENKEALNILQETQNRVMVMASLHQRLYQSQSFEEIDFKEFVNYLVEEFIPSYYRLDKRLITINTSKIENIFINISIAIPCSLIINELVSNSLKYAFPNGVKGEIFIELHSNNNDLTLIIGDNGKGLKIKDNNLDNYETLGFVLVKAQIRQLNGSCEIDSKDGTKFTIKFKNEHLKEEE